MKVLVTGANGYIGTHVVRWLAKNTLHQIVAVDISQGWNCERVLFKKLDLLAHASEPCLYRDLGCPDAVIHLAWKDGFKHNSDAHLQYLKPHYDFLRNMVEAGCKNWCLMAIGVTLSWAPLHLMSGCYPAGGVAFSLVIFLFVYVTVRFVRLLDLRFKWRWLGGTVVGYLALMLGFGGIFAMSRLALQKPFNGHVWHYFTTYDAPHVWLMAIVLLMVFAQKIRVWNWLGRLCTICGPSMFGVYLFHNVTVVGPATYCLAEKNMEGFGLHPLINVFVAAIMIFVLSVVVDFIRRGAVNVIRRIAVVARGGLC